MAAAVALQFWLMGIVMIMFALYWANPFSILFWPGILTCMLGMLSLFVGGGGRGGRGGRL